jgi:hypothetical protein
MTDHLWFIVRKTFEALNLEPGDAIEFDAMATPYKKGYRGHRDDPELPPPSVDYRLSFPTKVRKIHGTAPTVDEAVARTIGPMPTVQESLFA